MLVPQLLQYLMTGLGPVVSVGWVPKLAAVGLKFIAEFSICFRAPSTATFTMLAYNPTIAMNIAKKNARKKDPSTAIGFDASAVGFDAKADRVPPLMTTAIMPPTMAQTMLQSRITKPRPKAKPQPTMRNGASPIRYFRKP